MVVRSAKHWVRFSYQGTDFQYAGTALADAWGELHRGDREPWPDAKRLSALTRICPAAAVPGRTAAQLAPALQEAWRAFHRGDFEQAWQEGAALGPLGALVAAKAATVHASYLEPDGPRAVALLTEAAKRATAAAALAAELPNAYYFQAYAIGRLSQRVSIANALAAGHATRIRACLERTLALEPKHADAEIAFGLFHAEIVGKVGALAARFTYGASADAALQHFKAALKLDPGSAVAHMEYANGLLLLRGERAQKEARGLYERAAACRPRDAMQWLDIAQARAELS